MPSCVAIIQSERLMVIEDTQDLARAKDAWRGP